MANATLNWTNPTTRVDGSPLEAADIASIDVFDTGASDPATPVASLQGAATTLTTDTLTVGNHVFTVVVNDTTGHKSAPSNGAAITVPATLAAPSAVADLAATLNA